MRSRSPAPTPLSSASGAAPASSARRASQASTKPSEPAAAATPTTGFVRVRGAREHNLKNIDVDIPRDALVVFTGVSGSGKSSLAFGTLYAEAQRRYFESVAPYARRLIDQVGVPEVDAIDGLPPAVALKQQRGTPSTRSSVGSVTTLSSLIRMLYSRTGVYPPKQPMLFAEDFSPNTIQGACPACHGMGRVYDVTEQSMVPDDSLTIRQRAIAAWPPAWQGQNQRDILVTLGYDVDTPWRDLPKKDRDWILFTDETPTVPVYAGMTPEQTRAALKRRAEPSYQGTFTGARRYVLHTFASTQSALMKKRVSQYMLSSACAACHGKRLKPESLSVTFAGFDIAALSQLSLSRLADVLTPIARGDADADAAQIPDNAHPDDSAQGPTSATGKRRPRAATSNATVDARIDVKAKTKAQGKADAQHTLNADERREAVEKRIAAGGASHAAAPDIRRTANHSQEKRLAAQRLSGELLQRIRALTDLGLGYLTLDRSTPTLSSGELQRLRLATQLLSQLFGVIYVLDEPSAGLHPADGDALFEALQALKAAGNSLFVVEHDTRMMQRADWLVDVGPAAGEHGGRIVYSGPPAGLADIAESQTRPYLFREPNASSEPHTSSASATSVTNRTPRAPAGWLKLEQVSRNNLRAVDAAFPLGCFTAVTGVSGSGKSTLVSQVLPELVATHLGLPALAAAEDDDERDPLLADDAPQTQGTIVEGIDRVKRLVRVDQKPIGRTPRSNLATYTGLFDHVRKLFAATPLARRRHYDAGRFSFNVAKGRCPACEGEGWVSVELLFMPSVYAPCSTCEGRRYNDDTLAVRWQDANIADVLAMTVDSACAFFADEPQPMRVLALLQSIGLGYLRLGQPATELSGGEAQRIKLATELQRAQRGDTLYILDEPTTGLHPVDIDRLLTHLQGLVDAGNTVVVVEHDMRVAAQSDWLIDIGPGAGDNGGQIVACGRPDQVVASTRSRTAPYLRDALQRGAHE